jgi:hypothetical protein
MPKLQQRRRTSEDPDYRYNGWSDGLNTNQYRNKIKRTEMSAAQNVETNFNSVDKRLGTYYIGNSKDSRTRGLAMYTHTDGTKKIIRASGTTLQEYNSTTEDYDNLTGKTYTSDLNTDFIQAYDNLYVFNGTDNLTKYLYTASPPITVFVQIGPPTSPTATRGAGLSTGTYTYYYRLTHYNAIGETVGTSEFYTDVNIKREQWDAVNEKIALAWTNDGGTISGTNIYFGTTSGDETFMDTVEGSGTSYDDFGGTLVADGLTEVPETNSTGGVVAYAGAFDGTRLWCFKGSTLYYSGGGTADIDHFDSGSGGGALNISKGDGDEIKKVLATRDGTLICYKEFSTWKVFFSSEGIITLRNVNQFIGCVGRRAAVAVDDDQVFLSRFGIFTLGNQPNFPTDILRVRSISLPIDADIQKISSTNLPNVTMHYDYKRRLRLAVAEGGSAYNNVEYILKYGAWMRNTNINANCYVNFTDKMTGTPVLDELSKQHTLIGADDEGRVYETDHGYSDRGVSIDAYFDTNEDNQGEPSRFKKYYDQDVEIGKLQGNLDIYQFFDTGDDLKVTIANNAIGGVGSEAVGFTQVGLEVGTIVSSNAISATKRWRLFGRQQKNVRTRFRQDSSSGTFSVMSFAGVYRLKSRRQYESADILETSIV